MSEHREMESYKNARECGDCGESCRYGAYDEYETFFCAECWDAFDIQQQEDFNLKRAAQRKQLEIQQEDVFVKRIERFLREPQNQKRNLSNLDTFMGLTGPSRLELSLPKLSPPAISAHASARLLDVYMKFIPNVSEFPGAVLEDLYLSLWICNRYESQKAAVEKIIDALVPKLFWFNFSFGELSHPSSNAIGLKNYMRLKRYGEFELACTSFKGKMDLNQLFNTVTNVTATRALFSEDPIGKWNLPEYKTRRDIEQWLPCLLAHHHPQRVLELLYESKIGPTKDLLMFLINGNRYKAHILDVLRPDTMVYAEGMYDFEIPSEGDHGNLWITDYNKQYFISKVFGRQKSLVQHKRMLIDIMLDLIWDHHFQSIRKKLVPTHVFTDREILRWGIRCNIDWNRTNIYQYIMNRPVPTAYTMILGMLVASGFELPENTTFKTEIERKTWHKALRAGRAEFRKLARAIAKGLKYLPEVNEWIVFVIADFTLSNQGQVDL